jgi:hypothetical protein
MKTKLLIKIAIIGITLTICQYKNNNNNWLNFTMTEAIIINQDGIDFKGYFPDGKISIIKDEVTDKYITFWAEAVSFRTEASTPYLENHISHVTHNNRVFGKGFNVQDGFNDGGSWFIGIYKLSDGRLAGFFHAESHWTGDITAYKSIGVSYSSDNGRTWTSGSKILNVDYLKPTTPSWSGLGDGCVVYNDERKQYICYYCTFVNDESPNSKICMAASSDPTGASGTWKKWDGMDFTVEGYNNTTGIGGISTAIKGLQHNYGANPSVMWNSFLQKWVMVYHGWDPKVIYMSSSNNGLDWENPITITNINEETAWYPNLIGDNGDTIGGQTVKLYYARNLDFSTGIRELACRTITYNTEVKASTKKAKALTK